MRHSGLKYLLYALLALALAGCGISNLAGTNTGAPNSVAAKLVWGESKKTSKTLASVPATVNSIQVTVTGTGADNVTPIPVVRGTLPIDGSQGTIGGIYPGAVTLSVKALDVNKTVLYEGFAIGVVVAAAPAPAANAGTIVMSPPVEKAQDQPCIACHETTLDATGQNLVAEFKQSGHYTNSAWNTNVDFPGVVGTGCAGCHGPSHNVANPATAGRCYECHGAASAVAHQANATTGMDDFQNQCDKCHNSHNPAQFVGAGCTVCHAVGQNANSANFVNDNNGVRSITNEFGKWSHHVTGVSLNDAHCTACHLEGKVAYGKVVVDETKHMSDNQTHLRNADTDADMAWNPAAPSFTTLDTFCLSCHDANGATSPMSAKIQAVINANGIAAAGKTASPTNPFGDTISNQYDKLQRPAVVDAAGQFATGNNSHHAVLGQKYSGRTRTAGPRSVNVAAFTANSSATMPGTRKTIFDAGRFTADYTTLADAAGESVTRNGGSSLGDDSTLHCADCHTVGQYRAADIGTRYNKAVIGAHGSNNEYLLRNNAGTDARHVGAPVTTQDGTKPYLVCYNCHVQSVYAVNSHAGEEESTSNCNGYANTYNPFPNYTSTGTARLRSRTTTGAYAQSSAPGYGNIFGIQCAACHNSGLDNGFGGIHGSKIQTYTDGMGNASNHRRFMPGLNNSMFVPGTKGGFTGGTVAVYKNYSGNRNGSGTGKTSGQTFSLQPVRNTPYATAGYTGKAPSFSYTTGGINNDLNWEQRTAQSIVGQSDPVAGAMGCYTYGAPGTIKINALASAGYPADDVRGVATEGIKAYDGTTPAYGNWGGCTDHSNQQAKGTSPTRAVLRPVTY